MKATHLLKPLLLLPVLAVAVACSGGGAGSSGANTSLPAASGAVGSAPQTQRFAAADAGRAAHGRAALMQRAVISHGTLEMRAKDVGRARDSVLRLLHRWDGQVADEQTGSDPHGRMTSVSLELRIPSQDFETAMRQLAAVARTTHQQISSEDVTTQVIDVNARIRAKQDSIDRIETLLARARNLSQIIAIETDLGNRQAELDSLKQQQAWLSDQTSLSTVEVTISRGAAPVPRAHHDQGLLAGLSTGWRALATFAVGLLTVVGVLLPFAVAFGVVGVLLWLAWRRWGRRLALRGSVDTE